MCLKDRKTKEKEDINLLNKIGQFVNHHQESIKGKIVGVIKEGKITYLEIEAVNNNNEWDIWTVPKKYVTIKNN